MTRNQLSHKSVIINIAALVVILIVTGVTFSGILSNDKEFTNWDDNAYVTSQPLVIDKDKATVGNALKLSSKVAANYHPLTMISLALDYKRAGLSMPAFMTTQLFLHLVNVVLVFCFVFILLNRNIIVASFTAALFGVHPLHVESVAWISERKDVLYTMFYMASLLAYLIGRRRNKVSLLWISFLTFVFACLSKPMAVTLPLVLVLIDWFDGRSLKNAVLTTLHFWLVALIFGLITVSVQSSTSAGLVDTNTFTLGQRILYAFYAVAQYVIKLFNPTGLSAFYPYPQSPELGVPSFVVAVALLVMATLSSLVAIQWKRTSEYSKILVFGVAFFLITISIVLQFISVGGAMMADRYTYVPYIGLFVVLGYGFQQLMRTRLLRWIIISMMLLVVAVNARLTYARVEVWKNSKTLWTDVINQFPGNVKHAYNNRAAWYLEKGDLQRAERDYSLLLTLGTNKAYTYKGYGLLLQKTKRDSAAIIQFSRALELGGEDAQVLRARAASCMNIGDYSRALRDYLTLIRLDPNDPFLYGSALDAGIQCGDYQDALDATSIVPFSGKEASQILVARGAAYGMMGKHREASDEFQRALAADPSNANARNNLEISQKNAGVQR
jgi:tetratricopeptide (TPR) repeat protein